MKASGPDGTSWARETGRFDRNAVDGDLLPNEDTLIEGVNQFRRDNQRRGLERWAEKSPSESHGPSRLGVRSKMWIDKGYTGHN